MLPRKTEGLRKYIVPLYEKPVRRLLIQEEYAPVASLIFGPSDQPDRAELTELKSLWQELRDDILEAQRLYQPDRKPWGCIFD